MSQKTNKSNKNSSHANAASDMNNSLTNAADCTNSLVGSVNSSPYNTAKGQTNKKKNNPTNCK